MRLYICGPVTGIPENNLPAFEKAQDKLCKAGHTGLLPHFFVDQRESSWQVCMKDSIRAMMLCDGVAVLDGWEKSRGAMVEVKLAHGLDMPVRAVDEWTTLWL